MSKSRVVVLCMVLVWLAVVTVALLTLMKRNGALAELPSEVAIGTVIVLTPLALLGFTWLVLDKQQPSRRRYVPVLAFPWLAASVGYAISGSINHLRTAEQASPTREVTPSAPQVYWARSRGNGQASPQFYGDSVWLDALKMSSARRHPLDYSGDTILIAIRGIVRNQSGSTVHLGGYAVQYLGREGSGVGEFNCVLSSYWNCGLSTIDLRPGYVADFSAWVPLGPSLARRDTARVFVRFSVQP